MSAQIPYTARTGLADRRTERRVSNLAGEWLSLPFGNLTRNERVELTGTLTFTTYSPGGVLFPAFAAAADVSMTPWTDGAGTVYLFKWDATNHKIIITDGTGTELAPGTDISAIVDWPYRAIMVQGLTPRVQHRLTGSGRIYEVQIEVGTDFAASTTNYWIFTAYLRRMKTPSGPQGIGDTLGAISTRALSLADLEPQTVWEMPSGIDFAESDRLVVAATTFGSPGYLLGLTAWARVKRSV